MKRLLSGILLSMCPVLASPAAQAAGTEAKAAPAGNGVEDLSSPEQVKSLCLATRPVARVYFDGDSMEKSKKQDEYVAARRAAMHRLYRISVPASGFRLGDYRPRENSLELDLSRPPRAMHGVATLSIPSDSDVKFPVTPDQAKEVMSAMKAGTATMVTYFELSDEQGAACSGTAAADVFTISAVPVAFDLRDGMGKLLTRAETPRADKYRTLIGGYSGTPAAVLGAVDGEGFDAIALSRKLTAMNEPLKKCYVDRLKERPDAGGTVVIGVAVRPDGAVENVTFIADALRDEPLRKCIDDTVKSIKFSGVGEKQGAFLFRVPIELKLVSQR